MLVFSGSVGSRVVIAAAGGEFTEVLVFSRLCKVSGARGWAREACPVGPFLRGGWEGSGGLPGTRSSPGQVQLAGFPVSSPRARSVFEGRGRKWPRRELSSFAQLGAWEVWLSSLAPRTWAIARTAKPEPRRADSGTVFSF